jgi:hypothetical protein
MTRIVAPRAKAIEQLTVPTFVSTTTPLRMWNSDVWDGQKWDILEGSLAVGASTTLTINQGHVSGYWDYVQKYTANSNVACAFSVPLIGRYVQMKATVTSGLSATGSGIGTPTIFRLGSWGGHANGVKYGLVYGSSQFWPVPVDISGVTV